MEQDVKSIWNAQRNVMSDRSEEQVVIRHDKVDDKLHRFSDFLMGTST